MDLIQIELPASKSLSNRYLILKAALEATFKISNLSDSEDTLNLIKGLECKSNTLELGEGGTTYRFLLAYFAATKSNLNLNCAPSLKLRPIAPLVQVLESMGANIDYLEKDGFPPICIKNPIKNFSHLEINRTISSQFVSALLLIAPKYAGIKTIKLIGTNNSDSFIRMTLDCLAKFGIESKFEKDTILIFETPRNLRLEEVEIESDWTSASYFYAISALRGLDITLNINYPSIQEDSELVNIFKKFGIETVKNEYGIRIAKVAEVEKQWEFDLKQNIDLAPALIVLDALLETHIRFTGIENLRFKECDRILALQENLKLLGILFENKGSFWENIGTLKIPDKINIETYGDHRIAMSFALLKFYTEVQFDNPDCVQKSFPKFWEEFNKIPNRS